MPIPATPTGPLAAHANDSDPGRVVDRQRVARTVLGHGILLGIAGDALLRENAVGLNVTIWLLALVAAVVAVTHAQHGRIAPAQREPLAAAIAFALLLTLRDAPLLAVAAIVASLGSTALAALVAAPGALPPLSRLPVRAIVDAGARFVPQGLVGAIFFLVGDARLVVRGERRALAVTRVVVQAVGLAVAAGWLLLTLLRAGDAVFARTTDSLFAWSPPNVLQHVVFAALFAWPALGWLHRWSAYRGPLDLPVPLPTLSATNATTVLSTMNIVFVAFLAVQVRVLFGGQAYVQAVTGLTLAEYARSGFFALVVTTAVVLVTLLALDGAAAQGALAGVRRHRLLATSLVAMVALLLLSALVRMRLYMDAFGLSIDRVYATVAMAWITIALVGFGATVLRGRSDAFVAVALRSGWAVLLAVAIADPEGAVARSNLARAAAARGAFDAPYHATLSADATPALVAALAAAPPDSTTCAVAWRLMQRNDADHGFATWNLGRVRARDAVSAAAPTWRAACPRVAADTPRVP
ncbi:MAG: DUF4173 domain-containing protein [Gemmatimonadaceae bacterium]|nr:DUF4173 domain-containing protein [Gemmatimonadaceae bacterium]